MGPLGKGANIDFFLRFFFFLENCFWDGIVLSFWVHTGLLAWVNYVGERKGAFFLVPWWCSFATSICSPNEENPLKVCFNKHFKKSFGVSFFSSYFLKIRLCYNNKRETLMLIMVWYNLSDFSEKVQHHWKVFIAKEFIVFIEFVKAKEIEVNGQ